MLRLERYALLSGSLIDLRSYIYRGYSRGPRLIDMRALENSLYILINKTRILLTRNKGDYHVVRLELLYLLSR